MDTLNSRLKELIAAVTARGADVRTTEMEGAITSVQVLGLPGVSSFPMPTGTAIECLGAALQPDRQMALELA
jgi:hypothetical protein